jgi:signal transduction histidine kinase
MTTILLCMRNRRDRAHLARWLGERHNVVEAAKTIPAEGSFDLCILDAAALDRNRRAIAERREAERPVFLPFLLAARRRQVVRERGRLLADVDDVVWAPVARAEIDARIGALLRIRSLARLVQQRYVSLANQSSAAVLVVQAGRIEYANEAARRMFPGLDDIGAVHELVAPAYRGLFEEYTRRISAHTGGAAAGEAPLPTHVEVKINTAEERWAHASAAPTFEGDSRELLVTLLDVTESKRREHELRESRQRIQSLAGELVSVEQRERANLAGDIHDGVNQSLASLRMRLDLLARARDELDVEEELSVMRRILDEAITQVRSLIVELDPPSLRESGLPATLAWLVEHFRTDHGLDVELKAEVQEVRLPADLQHVLYRATRELLFNVLKHAPGARARVTLKREDTDVVIAVSDDGPGFEPEATNGGSGFGLFSLTERLRPFDGTVSIRSAPGEGTSVEQRVAHRIEETNDHEEANPARG